MEISSGHKIIESIYIIYMKYISNANYYNKANHVWLIIDSRKDHEHKFVCILIVDFVEHTKDSKTVLHKYALFFTVLDNGKL